MDQLTFGGRHKRENFEDADGLVAVSSLLAHSLVKGNIYVLTEPLKEFWHVDVVYFVLILSMGLYRVDHHHMILFIFW